MRSFSLLRSEIVLVSEGARRVLVQDAGAVQGAGIVSEGRRPSELHDGTDEGIDAQVGHTHIH